MASLSTASNLANPAPNSRDHRNQRKKRRPNNQHNDRTRNRKPNATAAVEIPAAKCSVCHEGEPKYKCPKCRSSYCSIVCCKRHKEEVGLCLVPSESLQEAGASTANAHPRKSRFAATAEYFDASIAPAMQLSAPPKHVKSIHPSHDAQDNDWKITADMTDAMHSSGWLREQLSDESLRHVITSIVKAPNLTRRNKDTTLQEDCLEQLKQASPDFRQFIDKLLLVTGIVQRTNHGEDGGGIAALDTEAWLRQSAVMEPLVLKSLPSKRKRPALETLLQKNEELSDSDGDESISSDSGEGTSDASECGEEGD
ncbi:hypothetical protein MPSEU_000647900 [Mayamaea pseudoterrestris]|nr:hypothetical protein MPSEU_000647900 [Mayamaea pseudoterrestris]